MKGGLIMATTRIMPLHIGKGRTESQAISDIIDYAANPQKQSYILVYGCFYFSRKGADANEITASISRPFFC